MAKKNDLTMHKLLGEHSYEEVFNKQVFEKEQICTVCGHVVNMKPPNIKEASSMLDAYRYRLVDSHTALETMGVTGDMSFELDVVIPKDIDRELTSLVAK